MVLFTMYCEQHMEQMEILVFKQVSQQKWCVIGADYWNISFQIYFYEQVSETEEKFERYQVLNINKIL